MKLRIKILEGYISEKYFTIKRFGMDLWFSHKRQSLVFMELMKTLAQDQMTHTVGYSLLRYETGLLSWYTREFSFTGLQDYFTYFWSTQS